MESYEKLKKILCTEIDDTVESIIKQGRMSMGDLEAVDKLTHSLKSLITTMAMEDSGYSYDNRYSGVRRRDNMGDTPMEDILIGIMMAIPKEDIVEMKVKLI